MDLWACRGPSRITSIKSVISENRLASVRTVPCVWCCVRVPSCSWPRPGTAAMSSTWRSNHVTEARVHRDVAPPLDSCDLGMESSGRCPTPSLLRAPLWTLQMTEILFHPVAGLPPAVWAQDATSQAASVEFPPHLLWMKARRWQMGLPSWLRWGTRTPPVFPANHEGSHVDDRKVAEDAVTSFKHKYLAAVIKFLLIPFKKEKSPASTNGRRMRQRDAVRAVLISSQRQIQSQPSKKTAPGLGSSPSCRERSSSVETPLPMSS